MQRCRLTRARASHWLLAFACSAAALAASPARAQFGAAADSASQQWAVLIGCEQYQHAPPLRYTVNDVQQLSKTLIERGGVAPERILEITDASSDPRYRPLQQSVMTALADWLKRPKPDDQILVYFSGHGFREPDGRMFLAPLDCDPANAAATGIPVEWFREQLAACPAKFKLLVLDSCHAGSEKGEDDSTGIVSKDLGEPFRELAGVVTLASSTGDEKSQLWSEKQQSLFSYWLNQGLKGHADEDGDGQVDVDELNEYVHRNVTHTASVRFAMPQTPVRLVRSGVGVPVIMHLRPASLKQVLADMADQLAWSLEERNIQKVGVLEFTNDTRVGELLGADYGLLGRYCAEELERQLTKIAGNKFTVVDRRRLQAALKAQQTTIDDLASTDRLAKLSTSAGGMPSIALGTLRDRAGRIVTIQCKLVRTDSDEVAGSAGGSASLNESEWAMLGRSIEVRPEDRPPPLPGTNPEELLIARLDDKARDPHPMTNASFPFRVRIMVAGKERKPVFQGNDMFVGLKQGEEFEVWVENNSGQIALMRLLIDGLNTLPQPLETKGIVEMAVAPRVNLDDARAWVLDPARGKLNAVRGFVTETGSQGELRKFLVVDADKSLAARQEFTDQIGMITAAFYSQGGSRGPLGVDLGQRLNEDLTERTGQSIGNLLGAVHIRYVDESSLPR